MYLSLEEAVLTVDGARARAAEIGRPLRATPQPLTDCRLAVVEAALAGPAQTFDGSDLYPTLPSKAAVLTYAVVKGHPCPDGNKRLALILTSAFLRKNGHVIDADDSEKEHIVRVTAESSPLRRDHVLADLGHWFASAMHPMEERSDGT